MKQRLYIHAASAISPQNTFEREHFLSPIVTSNNGRLYALDAPYAQYISPVAIRRMSRIMKMTISAAMQCLNEAGIQTPDAIITGTGRGGVTDMEVFVKEMIRLEEGPMNPTAFIQSTYNSPNGWIAKQADCTCYNQTYVHRGCSFELALLDAQMLMAEASERKKVLVGCYDEMTEEYFFIRGKRGYWKTDPINSLELFQHGNTTGTIGGEGAAFFILSNDSKGASAIIEAVRIIHDASSNGIAEVVVQMLQETNAGMDEISLMLTGLNGDVSQASLYVDVLGMAPQSMPIAVFKHLSGEYDTATGFGLWLANYLLIGKGVRNDLLLLDGATQPQKCSKILLINHFISGTASAILISNPD